MSEIKFKVLKEYAEKNNLKFAFVRDADSRLFFSNTKYTEKLDDKHWCIIEKLF